MALEVGRKPPDFRLPGTDGEISLSSLAGRKAVIFFYPKDDTSGCTQEAKDFQRLKKAFAAADTVVVGVSPDSLKKHAKFRAKYGLDLPLASDEEKELVTACGIWVEKRMWAHRYMGVERTTLLLGRDGTIAKIWEKVKVPGHADEVLTAAQAL